MLEFPDFRLVKIVPKFMVVGMENMEACLEECRPSWDTPPQSLEQYLEKIEAAKFGVGEFGVWSSHCHHT